MSEASAPEDSRRDDARPLVERDPTPPYGMTPVARRPPRQWSGPITLAIVLVSAVAVTVYVWAQSM